MPRIRVVVVEDSLTVRRRLVEVLASDPEISVVGEAGDGKEGVELCQALRPDVLTVDLVLPLMSGLTVTEYVMAYCPTPILIVSSSANRGELLRTYDALAAGALDTLDKPGGDEADGVWERELLARVKLLSRIKVITHLRRRMRSPDQGGPPARKPGAVRLVAIGASTGGPAAVKRVLEGLPASFPAPILLVIHIALGEFLAQWLDSQSQLRVTGAVDGESLPAAGRVIIAPPGRHMALSEGRIRLTDGPERHSCRPSIDVLFESVAREAAARSIACVMTGMGRDGAQGLLAVRRAGGYTLAQDEASSVVFGMPGEAIRIGAAERVLSLGEIAPALVALCPPSRAAALDAPCSHSEDPSCRPEAARSLVRGG